MLEYYRLVEIIGEGGMGVVWKAVDTHLDREVAVKLLPAALSANPDRLQRFEREAKLLASLNHPHIATIHGLHQAGPDGSIRFLVMELVEGEDLQQRLQRGPIPLERSLEIATQVALALEAAHAQGIVHRDLKPANVKLTAKGEIKVLDFGLAKALSPEAISEDAAASLSMSPTLTSAGTIAGMLIGTAGYMSPEQARGKDVDKRADLWAFGCLLYEMLTGRRCFEGETISDTLASVLKEMPDWSGLPTGTPPAIHRLLRRCLAKPSRQRLSDAGDARLELAEALDPVPPEERAGGENAGTTRAGGNRLPWVVAIAGILLAVTAFILGNREPTAAAASLLDLSISVPHDVELESDQHSMLELSRDGKYLVFTGFQDGSSNSTLFLRMLEDASVVQLPDTTNAVNPFFSPDGKWIGFFANGKLKKIRIDGSTAVPICDMTGNPRGATWSDDGRIFYPAHFSGSLMQVSSAGGEPTPLTELDQDRRERTHRWPQAVPGTDVVLFTVATIDSPEFYDDAHIDALRLSTGERKTVFDGASFARYVPPGHLVIGRNGFLFAVPFDIDRLEATGPASPVLEGVLGNSDSGAVFTSISESGLMAYVPGKSAGKRNRLQIFYQDGRTEPVPGADAGIYQNPSISPDGRSIAVAIADERQADIWILDMENRSRLRLTFEGNNSMPFWSPDGASVLFYSIRNGQGAVYITSSNGSGNERLVQAVEGETVTPGSISPDGRFAAITVHGKTNANIYLRSLTDPEAERVPLITGPSDMRDPQFSPDGHWLAYISDETGNYQVFVQPYPGPGGRWQISSKGGIGPRWSRNGRQIHYFVNREWWIVDVQPGDSGAFRVGTPRLVRDALPPLNLDSRAGSLSSDDKSIVLPVPLEKGAAADKIQVFVNWTSQLSRMAP